MTIALHAEHKGFLPALEEMLDLVLYFIDTAGMRHAALAPVGREDKNPVGFAQNRDVRIVCGEDQLPAALRLLEIADDGVVDKGIVEVVLRLVDQQRPFAL